MTSLRVGFDWLMEWRLRPSLPEAGVTETDPAPKRKSSRDPPLSSCKSTTEAGAAGGPCPPGVLPGRQQVKRSWSGWVLGFVISSELPGQSSSQAPYRPDALTRHKTVSLLATHGGFDLPTHAAVHVPASPLSCLLGKIRRSLDRSMQKISQVTEAFESLF